MTDFHVTDAEIDECIDMATRVTMILLPKTSTTPIDDAAKAMATLCMVMSSLIGSHTDEPAGREAGAKVVYERLRGLLGLEEAADDAPVA